MSDGPLTEQNIPELDHDFLNQRDPIIDWQTAQEYGLFSMAADLIRDHVARLRDGAATDVIVLDEWRRRT